LYRGQLFEKLRLNNKKVSNRDTLQDTNRNTDTTTETDATDNVDDKTVTDDDVFSGTVNTDDDLEALSYEFDKSFPEITKHAEAYEAEIAKLIENLDMDIETYNKGEELKPKTLLTLFYYSRPACRLGY
jgi:hypothetical protein